MWNDSRHYFILELHETIKVLSEGSTLTDQSFDFNTLDSRTCYDELLYSFVSLSIAGGVEKTNIFVQQTVQMSNFSIAYNHYKPYSFFEMKIAK